MKLNTLKRTAAIGALGLFALLGTNQVANAQTYRDYQREQRRAQRQYEKDQRRYERQAQRAQYRAYANGRYYTIDDRGAEILRQAVNSGYQQGYRAGQGDRGYRRSYNYGGVSTYRSGSYGYNSYVDSSAYRYYFQQGFQRGYEDGYYSRNRYGYNSNNGLNILGSILSGILNLRSY